MTLPSFKYFKHVFWGISSKEYSSEYNQSSTVDGIMFAASLCVCVYVYTLCIHYTGPIWVMDLKIEDIFWQCGHFGPPLQRDIQGSYLVLGAG